MQHEKAKTSFDTPFYNKARRYYHIGSYSLVGILLISVVFSYVLNSPAFDLLRNVFLALLSLASYIAIPIGLINIIKSIRRKEPANKYRGYYLAALIFIQLCLAVLLLFMAIGLVSNI